MKILFDVGGTRTRVALADDPDFRNAVVFETPKNYEEGIATLVSQIKTISNNQYIDKLVGGLPGPIDKQNGMLRNAPNLKDWVEKPVTQRLEEICSTPTIILENDAALAGLGEAVYGAAKGHAIVAYITVSTGVGGARIVNAKIDENFLGFEPGHQIIKDNQTLENLVSGTAIRSRHGKAASEISSDSVWDEIAKNLAIGLNNTIVHWSPNIVVIGGAVSQKIPFQRLNSYLSDLVTIYPEIPEVVPTQLKDLSGLYGAMVLAQD